MDRLTQEEIFLFMFKLNPLCLAMAHNKAMSHRHGAQTRPRVIARLR